MNAAAQIIVHGASLLTALFIGAFFNVAFWQVAFHAKPLLRGKPLPAITQFFTEHNALPLYLILLPWLWLVGGPLFTRAGVRISYWDVPAFVTRYLAFIAVEFLLLLLMTFFLFLPFVAYYEVLQSSGTGTFELTARLMFWGLVVGLMSLGFYRWYQARRSTF